MSRMQLSLHPLASAASATAARTKRKRSGWDGMLIASRRSPR
jgi:hypothetical protein